MKLADKVALVEDTERTVARTRGQSIQSRNEQHPPPKAQFPKTSHTLERTEYPSVDYRRSRRKVQGD